jgi:DNA-binding Xre family transcriptional regulator
MANFSYIKYLAEAKGITIRHLAESVGMTDTALHAMIKNNTTKTSTIEAIAKILEVPVGYFFDDMSIHSISQKGGKGSAMAVNGNANAGIFAKENELLKQLLDEKERTIQILINKQ